MREDDDRFRSRVGQSLGASRVVALSKLPSGGPLDLLELRAEVMSRLRSTGGRPTDPEWDTQRLVPFRSERWKQLETLAGSLSTQERKVSPGQLAAILIERGLQEVESDLQRR